jgi:hypothetical protein
MGYEMKKLDSLDRCDLATQGDRHEQEFWPLLATRFPSYELLWRRLIVPLTSRIDPRAAAEDPRKWIRFRADIPEKYEQMAMAHYSVFYFLGRAADRALGDASAFEHPEDVFFLLDSSGDNFKLFLDAMNAIGKDNGGPLFEPGPITQFPKGFGPFEEISDYRDVQLHNPVIGRAMDVEKVYLPKWQRGNSGSPLERAKKRWRDAEALSSDVLIDSRDLLDRLLSEVCELLEKHWRTALTLIERIGFEDKSIRVLKLEKYLPLPGEWKPPRRTQTKP